MRLYRYIAGAGAEPRLAVSLPGRPPVDVGRAWEAGGDRPARVFDGSTLALIQAGATVWTQVREAVAGAGDDLAVDTTAAGFKVLCPLDAAASLRDFLTFEDHVKLGAQRRDSEVPDYWYEAPVYYKGNHRSIIGPEDVCPWPSYTEMLDFELELALLVGEPGIDIAADDAAGHIFGFTVMNDFSARDVQRREMSTWLGPAKGKDFATALGPCIVTIEELGAEPDLEMICRVNGEEWGRARSSEMHWRWADLVAHASKGEAIYPGDVYGSGTPGGCCGLDLGRQLGSGDIVELEIENIGVLRNQIGPRQASPRP